MKEGSTCLRRPQCVLCNALLATVRINYPHLIKQILNLQSFVNSNTNKPLILNPIHILQNSMVVQPYSLLKVHKTCIY